MKEDIINKVFPTEEMRREFLVYQDLKTGEDKKSYMQAKKSELSLLTDTERNERMGNAIQAGTNVVREYKNLIVLRLLQSVSPYISLSEISKTYFGKSGGWLSQRLRENEVRGKKVCLKPDEIDILQSALLDLSDKLKKTAYSLGKA